MTKAARSTPRMSPLDSRQPTKSPWAPKKDMRDLLRRSPAATALLLAALALSFSPCHSPAALMAARGHGRQNATLENAPSKRAAGRTPQAEVPGARPQPGTRAPRKPRALRPAPRKRKRARQHRRGRRHPLHCQEHAPTGHGAETGEHAEEQRRAHGESIWSTIARLVNFAILAGTLIYFLRSRSLSTW